MKKNLTKAVSLAILVLIVGLGILLSGKAFVLLTDTLTLKGHSVLAIRTPPIITVLSVLMALVVSAMVLSPLMLSIKKWYWKLRDSNPSLSEALFAFTDGKIYFRTIWYSIVKITLLVLIFALPLAPIIFIGSVLRTQINHPNQVLSALFLILFLSMVILGIVAVCFAFYIALGFFYADYLFLEGMTSHPIVAIKLSFMLSKKHRKQLISTYISVLPYVLLSVFVVPIVFTIPYINSTLAFFAKGELDFLCEQKCICD